MDLNISDLAVLGNIGDPCKGQIRRRVKGHIYNLDCVLDADHKGRHELADGHTFVSMEGNA